MSAHNPFKSYPTPTLRSELSRAGIMPATPGYISGLPDYESNPDLLIVTKLGNAGMPGVYGMIEQQWYRVSCLMEQGRDRLGAMSIHIPELIDESPEEKAFNESIFTMIMSQRIGVESASPGSIQWGWRYWASYVHDAYWYGCALASPYWSGEAGDLERGSIVLQPLMLSAVQRFRTEWGTSRILGVDYQGSAQWTFVPYERLIHVIPKGQPGQLFGEAAMRSLVLPGLSWIQSQVQCTRAEVASAGLLKITESNQAQDGDRLAYLSAARQYANGRLPWIIRKSEESGEDMEIIFPPGSGFNFSERQSNLDAVADFVFAERNGSLYSSGSGSRAASETISGEDADSQEYTADKLIDIAWQSIAKWIANQVGYSGRIRSAETQQSDAQMTGTALVSAIASGATSGAVKVTPEVTVAVHKALRLPLPPEEVGTSKSIQIGVGAAQAALVIIQQVAPTDPTVSAISSVAAIELLVAVGIPLDAAERMVKAQLASGQSSVASVNTSANILEPKENVSNVSPETSEGAGTIDPRDTELDDMAWMNDPVDCGCSKCNTAIMKDERKHVIVGSDGLDYPSRNLPVQFSIDGVDVPIYPETHVAWMSETVDDEEAFSNLTLAIEPIRADHFAEAIALVRSGQGSPAQLDLLRNRYEVLYLKVIREYILKVRQLAAERTSEIATSQSADAPSVTDLGLRNSTVDQIAASVSLRTTSDLRSQVAQSAASIASRVQSDAVNAAITSRNLPSITPKGLAMEARASGDLAAESQRIMTSVRDTPSGLVLIGFIRTDARNSSVCGHCFSQHGLSWVFPKDGLAFIAYTEEFGPPDKQCAGAPRCRCRLVPVYGRMSANASATSTAP